MTKNLRCDDAAKREINCTMANSAGDCDDADNCDDADHRDDR